MFSRRFRTIVYSRRYHWPNEPIPDGVDYSMLEHVEDLRKILTKLDLGPVHLVGHSYGGAELTGSGFPPLSRRELTGVHVPTLLVCGSRSPEIFHRLNDRLEALLPMNQRIHIEDASHIMHEDNPEAFNDAVLSFLSNA